MRKHLIHLMLLALFMVGCQTLNVSPTDAMPVKHLRVNNVDLAYVEEGSGTTVLFVHGASGDWRTWDGFRPYVAPKFHFVSMSRRYHFPNLWTDAGENYTFDQQVEDVAGFIRALNVGKVHLVGNSYSGRLVGFAAVKYPELVRSVVLGEPSLAAPVSAEGRASVAAYAKDLGKASAMAKSGDERQAAILVANAVLDDTDGFTKMSPVQQQRWLDNAKTMRPMFSGRPTPPLTCEQLKAMKVPALAIRGANTRASFKYGHDALLACLPATAEGAVIPAARHQWPIDNPAAAASAILAFLSKY